MGRIVCASIGGFVAGVVATVIVLRYHYGLVDRVEAGLFAIQNRVCGRPEWMGPEITTDGEIHDGEGGG